MKKKIGVISLVLLLLALFVANIFWGSVHIDAAEVVRAVIHPGDNDNIAFIINNSRMPAALTATLAGASLAAAGLMLQTAFHNPLVGPSILGISAGANLGVAIVMLAMGGGVVTSVYAVNENVAVIAAALIGSLAVMALLIFFSAILRNNLMLLITGIMVGYLTSSIISLLNFLASAENIQGFIIWGMGNFNGVSMRQMPVFALLCIVGLVLSLLLVKSLNAILLGERYAVNLGVNMQRARTLLLLATGLLTAVITAYCGPIAFIGLATPHIAFLAIGTNNHRLLMPTTMLSGSIIALLCNLISTMPSNTVIPLNAVTPIMGVPVILYIVLKRDV